MSFHLDFCLPKVAGLTTQAVFFLFWFEVIGSCSLYLKKEKKKLKKRPQRPDSLISLIPSQKYTAIGMLGKATDTLDATGKVTEEKPYGKHKYIYALDVIWRHKWYLS